GLVRSVAGAAGPSGLLPIVVAVSDARAIAGLTAEVALQVPLPEGRTVPVSAVVDPVGAGPVVFVVREGAVQRVPVAVGVLLGDRVVVEGALAVGESVVVAGQPRLLPGDVVEVLP
ncbi:MAG: hypothetical protein KTR31_14370, partial [Myxococcales bacterium]|nr:hypothetical protein [Myxococcales bacterium]